MVKINDLSQTDEIVDDDKFVVFKTVNGDTRQVAASTMAEYFASEITLGDLVNASWVIPLQETYIIPQPVDATLTALAGLGLVDGKIIRGTGVDTGELIEFSDRFHVDDYGAVGDGTTDDADAIQDAIDAAEAAGGGEVVFGANTYAIETGLTIRANGVLLKGQGYDVRHNVGTAFVSATVIKATAAMTTMISHAPTEGASAQFLVGGGVVGLELDCDDTADEGLHVQSVRFGKYDLSGRNANDYLFRFGVVTTLGEGTSTQDCDITLFGDQRGSTGVGFHCYGIVPNGNFSYNQKVSITIQHTDATAMIFDSSDNNTIQLLRATRTSGTGEGIIFNGASDVGTCRGNTFMRVYSNASVIARGTSSFTNASGENIIFEYDKENGIADPTIETGAVLWWRSNLSNRWNFVDLQATGELRFGGTALLKAASESSWTPTISASSGTFADASVGFSRFSRVGPLVYFSASIVCGAAGIGTAAGTLQITAPSTPVYGGAASGVNATNGRAISVRIAASSSTIRILEYQGNFPIANSQTVIVSGFYLEA